MTDFSNIYLNHCLICTTAWNRSTSSPRDFDPPPHPYKRVETIPSSREIHIECNGHVVAQSTKNVFLYETLLRTRYYLTSTSVDWSCFSKSATTSFCPYKGMANYYDLKVNGKEIKDAVWYYKYPTSGSALIAGRLCFYYEKVDVFVNSVKDEK